MSSLKVPQFGRAPLYELLPCRMFSYTYKKKSYSSLGCFRTCRVLIHQTSVMCVFNRGARVVFPIVVDGMSDSDVVSGVVAGVCIAYEETTELEIGPMLYDRRYICIDIGKPLVKPVELPLTKGNRK